MKNKIYKFIYALGLMTPFLANAQNDNKPKLDSTRGILESIKNIVNDILIPLAFFLALFYFFWGVAKYIKTEGTGKAEGKQIMLWGVIGLFVISSVWGLVSFIQGELGVDSTKTEQNIPTLKIK